MIDTKEGWSMLLATHFSTESDEYHLVIAQDENHVCDKTLCGRKRSIVDSVLSLPIKKGHECRACVEGLAAAIVAD